MMKKFFSLFMLGVALSAFPIALVGCGGGASSESQVETPSDMPDEDPDEEPGEEG